MDEDDFYGRQHGRFVGNDPGNIRNHRDDMRGRSIQDRFAMGGGDDYYGSRPHSNQDRLGGGFDDYHGRGRGGGFDEFHSSRSSSHDHLDGGFEDRGYNDFQGRPSYDRSLRGHESASRAWNNRRREQDSGFRHIEQEGFHPSDEPASFGDEKPDLDPLGMERSTKEDCKPGAFSASHDAVSAKIAAFDGKSDGNMSRFNEARIEIAPGHFARLRGAQETWNCIEEDFYLPVTCFCCSSEICCIMDASYVLCPQCRVVSPMEGCGGTDGGVGLGFTVEELRKWQHEILLKRTTSGARF